MRRIVLFGLIPGLVLALAMLTGRGQPAHAWTGPAALNTNAATDSGDDIGPQVTTDGQGNWVAVWQSTENLGGIGTDNDILVARSTDGITWTPPAVLNNNAASDSGHDYVPKVATDGAGNWVAVWDSLDSLGDTIGTDGDILVSRSTNNGATWTAPVALNTNAASDSGHDRFAQVTADGRGNWVAVWESTEDLDGIGTDFDILVARSTDNGATWTPVTYLNNNADTDSGSDVQAQVTTDGGGKWIAVWFSHEANIGGGIGGDYDILVARSTDNGTTWTAPAALNTNAATDSGFDEHPQVTTNGRGNWVAVWWSNEDVGGTVGTDCDILVARSTDNGATWTAPAALNTNATTDTGADAVPQVTTGGGNWLAVWYSDENLGGTIETDLDILVARSTDSGATWTAPAALNSNAATDSGDDEFPQLTTDADGGGNWVTVWRSDDDLGGPIGTDYDILYATEWIPILPVGGIAQLPDVSDSAGRSYMALAALAAAALLALTAGGWYARRRLS